MRAGRGRQYRDAVQKRDLPPVSVPPMRKPKLPAKLKPAGRIDKKSKFL
jgi:hypothetical protein